MTSQVHTKVLLIQFYSNWTFIAFNLPKQEDSKAQQNKKADIKIFVSIVIAGVKHHRELHGNDPG